MILATEDIILRANSPLQNFLGTINQILQWILLVVKSILIPNLIQLDPLLMLPFGFLAVMGTVGILKRIISKD